MKHLEIKDRLVPNWFELKKSFKISENYTITVPAIVRDAYGWGVGKRLKISFDANGREMRVKE